MTENKPKRIVPLSGTNALYNLVNPSYRYDISDAFRRNNASMCNNNGKNENTYNVEDTVYWNNFYRANERSMAYGFPGTFVLQGAFFYLCAIYTAREQGLIKKNEFWARFHFWLIVYLFYRFGLPRLRLYFLSKLIFFFESPLN